MSTASQNSIRCSQIQANRTQCTRAADKAKPDDKDYREALCTVCWLLKGSPKDYTVEL